MKLKRRVVLLAVALTILVPACRSSEQGAGEGSYATRKSQGDISFELTPKRVGDQALVVEIRANTHSGDLADLDLTKALTLEADGKTYQPEEATGLEGHHASGSVTFRPDGTPDRFTITLAPVRGMEEQRFEWP